MLQAVHLCFASCFERTSICCAVFLRELLRGVSLTQNFDDRPDMDKGSIFKQQNMRRKCEWTDEMQRRPGPQHVDTSFVTRTWGARPPRPAKAKSEEEKEGGGGDEEEEREEDQTKKRARNSSVQIFR